MLAVVCLMPLPEITHFSSTDSERDVYLPSQLYTLYSAIVKLCKIVLFTLVFWTVIAAAGNANVSLVVPVKSLITSDRKDKEGFWRVVGFVRVCGGFLVACSRASCHCGLGQITEQSRINFYKGIQPRKSLQIVHVMSVQKTYLVSWGQSILCTDI